MIRDGFTHTDKFPASGWMPEVTFTYRPALPEEEEDFRIEMARAKDGKQIVSAYAKFLKSHLTGWSLDDKHDSLQSYRSIPMVVLKYMSDCICNYGPKRSEDEGNSE